MKVKHAVTSLRMWSSPILTIIFAFSFAAMPIPAQTPIRAPAAQRQRDNGIHVGEPKVYDSRELTLMLDNLSQTLQNRNFVDPRALANALGYIQGYQANDSSQALLGNAAVGSQAASIFAGGGEATASAPINNSLSTPGVTINVAPTANAGTSVPAADGAPPSMSVGPQTPALPPLQRAPAYAPNFGSNGSDLLSDEVNLTYQLYNVRMLLDRSLTDRLHGNDARLEAVVGFDVDLEPNESAKNAAATVEITAAMSTYPSQLNCDPNGKLSVVALMPEEGSHNAATLSQKANAFGGAIASSVFSLGFAAQKRSQVFYLYRDMDTVSFQHSTADPASAKFGWQFRPVLGRRSVDPGVRHMIVVLGLPCSDVGVGAPHVEMQIQTGWERYDSRTQTTAAKTGRRSRLLPPALNANLGGADVPSSDYSQQRLQPYIDNVKWVPAGAGNGVAIVTGKNFFSGTTVRLGGKTYGNASDGLVINSDHELEVTAPLIAATTGGVLSGRYGRAQPLEPRVSPVSAQGFKLAGMRLRPLGEDTYEVIADLAIQSEDGHSATLKEIERNLNAPVLLVNGAPIPAAPYLSQPANSSMVELITFVPAAVLAKGAPLFTVTFPFAGPAWTASMPYYTADLKVSRLGGGKETRLIIFYTEPAVSLCRDWVLQLEDGKEFSLLADTAPTPGAGALTCMDGRTQTLSFVIPSKDLRIYKHFLLINRPRPSATDTHPEARAPLIGEIPSPDPPPPAPSLDKDQKVSVAQNDVYPIKFTGKHLDQVTKVLFDKIELRIVAQSDKDILISLSPQVTAKVREGVGLQLVSEGNDPIIARFAVAPPKTGAATKKEK